MVLFCPVGDQFFGVFNLFHTGKDLRDDLLSGMLGDALGAPDFLTIFLAAVSVGFGLVIRRVAVTDKNKGKQWKPLVICGVVCIALTFTPLSRISLFIDASRVAAEQRTPNTYEELAPENCEIYAFLGSDKSDPSDVDLFAYQGGYDGSAKEEYSKYKICGYFRNVSGESFMELCVDFALVGADGNDLVKDGEPVVLSKTFSNLPGDTGMERFETQVIAAKSLPAVPVGFRVVSVRYGYHIQSDR